MLKIFNPLSPSVKKIVGECHNMFTEYLSLSSDTDTVFQKKYNSQKKKKTFCPTFSEIMIG